MQNWEIQLNQMLTQATYFFKTLAEFIDEERGYRKQSKAEDAADRQERKEQEIKDKQAYDAKWNPPQNPPTA